MNERLGSGSVVPFARRWHVIQEIDLVELVTRHEDLARLCDQLEACADALPAPPDRATIDALCHMLDDVAKRHERTRPAIADLLDRAPVHPIATALIDRARTRHTAEEVHARDLIEALRVVGLHGHARSRDTLGYMLRCFFSSSRMGIEAEELALLAVAGHRLAADARDTLTARLCWRRRSPI